MLPQVATLMWRVSKWEEEGGREGRDRGNKRGEMQDRGGRTTLPLIQLLQAEQLWLALRSWKRGGSGESKLDRNRRRRETHSRVTEKDGKCWRRDRKGDVERLKEEEQVAVLDNVDKAQTSHLSSKTHKHTQNRVCRKPNTLISQSCWPDEGQQNRREMRRGEIHSAEQHNVP